MNREGNSLGHSLQRRSVIPVNPQELSFQYRGWVRSYGCATPAKDHTRKVWNPGQAKVEVPQRHLRPASHRKAQGSAVDPIALWALDVAHLQGRRVTTPVDNRTAKEGTSIEEWSSAFPSKSLKSSDERSRCSSYRILFPANIACPIVVRGQRKTTPP